MLPNRAKHLILSSNTKLITNPKSIAGAFNDYFVHIGPSLSKQTPETNSLFTNFSNVQSLNSLLITETEIGEIPKIILDLMVTNLKVLKVFRSLFQKKILKCYQLLSPS